MNRRIFYPTIFAILLPLAAFPAAPKQQSSGTSVAEAARRNREMKAREQNKPTKVITDEDVAHIKGSISVVGPAATPAPSVAAPEGTPGPAPAKPVAKLGTLPSGKDEAGWRALFAAAHKALSDDARELDILQREFNLKQQQFYSDPNVALREQTSRRDLDTTQKAIEEKKQAVETDRQAIADLEDDLRKAGGEPAWAQEGATLPVPPQPPSDGQPKTP